MKKLLSILLAVLMLTVIMAGCKSDNGNTDTNTTTKTTEPTTVSTITTAPTQTDYTGVYDDLLFEIYQNILYITYDPENTEDYEGTMGIREA